MPLSDVCDRMIMAHLQNHKLILNGHSNSIMANMSGIDDSSYHYKDQQLTMYM